MASNQLFSRAARTRKSKDNRSKSHLRAVPASREYLVKRERSLARHFYPRDAAHVIIIWRRGGTRLVHPARRWRAGEDALRRTIKLRECDSWRQLHDRRHGVTVCYVGPFDDAIVHVIQIRAIHRDRLRITAPTRSAVTCDEWVGRVIR